MHENVATVVEESKLRKVRRDWILIGLLNVRVRIYMHTVPRTCVDVKRLHTEYANGLRVWAH